VNGRGTERRRWLRIGEWLLWAVLFVIVAERFGPQASAWLGIAPPLGDAPSLEVVTLDGTHLDAAAMEGRIQVVTFWATWCRICRRELPAVEAIHREFGGDGRVLVLGLSIDRDPAEQVRDYTARHGITFPQAMADAATRGAFGGIPGIPATFVIDGDGVLRHRLVGLSGPGTLRRAVERLLEEE